MEKTRQIAADAQTKVSCSILKTKGSKRISFNSQSSQYIQNLLCTMRDFQNLDFGF